MITRLLSFLTLCTATLMGSGPSPKTDSYAEFSFKLETRSGNPFAREVFAEVSLPGARTLRLPAFLKEGRSTWAVRARVDAAGDYRLLRVWERVDGSELELAPQGGSKRVVSCSPKETRGFIRIDPKDPCRFAFDDSTPYFPIGTNHAWVFNKDYDTPLAAFGKQGLNWTRIWMAHWGNANPEWLEKSWFHSSPKPGVYNWGVIGYWDTIVDAAERHGVYFQLVFQHHGQYSTAVNPSWNDNPWNVANGGFLERQGDFFRSPLARQLTKQKLRYAVARWSYSTSIMAWELFNEVMFTDACRMDKDLTTVAAWHNEMADYLRSIDPYRHLITTSHDDTRSPIYERMDYYQPHNYSIDMIQSVRSFSEPPDGKKPIFYGEMGDDKVPCSEADKARGTSIDYITWASLAGGTQLPAQQWRGDLLLSTGMLRMIGSAARFARAAKLESRGGFSLLPASISCEDTIPAQYPASFLWDRRHPTTVPVSDQGDAVPALADIPCIIVGTARQVEEGYADRLSFDFDRKVPTKAILHFTECGPKGASIDILLDGSVVATRTWPVRDLASALGGKLPPEPVDVNLTIPTGKHHLSIINHGEDSVRFGSLNLDYRFPILSCFGKQTKDFALIFVWHRSGVCTRGSSPSTGTITLTTLQAGTWRATWWDIEKGEAGFQETLHSDGRILQLKTPPISRYGAVMLERMP